MRNRAQLMDDSGFLADYGFVDFEVKMKIMWYLRREKDYVPWKSGVDFFLNRNMRQNPLFHLFLKALVSQR